jgi:hypothetical protein
MKNVKSEEITRGLAIARAGERVYERHFDACWSIRIGEGKQEKSQRKETRYTI